MNSNSIFTKEDKKQAEFDHVEESARFIKLLHGQFRQMGYRLNKRKKLAAVRVLEAVLFEPLEEIELIGKEEKELFAICNQIMYHKNKLAAYAVERKIEKEQNNEREN